MSTTPITSLMLENTDPPWFWLGLAILCVAVLSLTYTGIYRRSGRPLVWGLLALRITAVMLLLIALVKPSWTHSSSQTHRPSLAVVLDDSQSMSLPYQPTAGAAPTSRYQLARRWLEDSPAGQALREHFELSYYDIQGKPLGAKTLPRQPQAEQTDLQRALRSASAQQRGQGLQAIVLLTDGNDTTPGQNLLAMRSFDLPVFPVGFEPAAQRDPADFDLSIVSLQAPARALVHNGVPIQVALRKDAGPAVQAALQIERAGQVLALEKFELPAGPTDRLVNLSFTPAEAGDFVLAARLICTPADRTAVNNTRLFKLRVEAQRIRVLYLEGVLRHEYAFLVQRLGQDPDLELASFVRTANPAESPVTGALVGRELVTPERLEKIEVILLGDFEASMLDETTYQAIRTRVEKGAGLMILGGYRNLGEQGFWSTPLAELIPAQPPTGDLLQLDEPFLMSLTPAGQRHPALHLTGDLARDQALWQNLPQLPGITLVGPARPGATVLSQHPRTDPLRPSDPPPIVLAVQPYGQGAVALLTADATWRWSRIPRLLGQPDTLYVRFWSQMVRWLARRDLQGQTTVLTVTADEPSYRRGRRVNLAIRRNPAALIPDEPAGPKQMVISILTPDNQTLNLPAAPVPSQTDAWTASFFPNRSGRFEASARLQASVPDAPPRDLASAATEFLVEGSSLELDQSQPNPALLRELARATGGIYTAIDNPQAGEELAQSLPAQPRLTHQTRSTRLWNSPALFFLFLAMVTVEWVVRRRHQLV